MDAKTEFNKMLKDLTASAREFAAMGLTMGTKALQYTGAQLKTIEETLNKTVERLKKEESEAKPAEKNEPAKA